MHVWSAPTENHPYKTVNVVKCSSKVKPTYLLFDVFRSPGNLAKYFDQVILKDAYILM